MKQQDFEKILKMYFVILINAYLIKEIKSKSLTQIDTWLCLIVLFEKDFRMVDNVLRLARTKDIFENPASVTRLIYYTLTINTFLYTLVNDPKVILKTI